MSFVYLCWTFGGSKYKLKRTDDGYCLDQSVINDKTRPSIQDESVEVSDSAMAVDELFYEERGSYNYDKMFEQCDEVVLQFIRDIEDN